jgi:Cu/Ag efflux protein CusF
MAPVEMVEVMLKRLTALFICLMVATTAHAQSGGGGGRGRGGGGGASPSAPSSSPSGPTAPRRAQTPVNQLQIIGVVKAIDLETQRITIAYDAVEALNWPPGTMPFPVSKTAMLTSATVGEKVRFSIDGGQISALKAFDAP